MTPDDFHTIRETLGRWGWVQKVGSMFAASFDLKGTPVDWWESVSIDLEVLGSNTVDLQTAAERLDGWILVASTYSDGLDVPKGFMTATIELKRPAEMSPEWLCPRPEPARNEEPNG